MKLAIAFLISPLIVSLMVPVAMGLLEGNVVLFMPSLIVILPVVYFFTVVVAAPTYFAMPMQHKKRLSSLMFASFVVAFASYALLNLPYSRIVSDLPVPKDVFIPGGVQLLFKQCSLFGLAGAGGGLCFWLIMRERHV
jgi:hypothetical protein